ncbi:MAG: hypothetical protein PHI86_02480 [Candidatus Omnitrophica bacterium]|nr:hypothetical protein [Candidatus Omnitrophota bacterium]HOX55041.1 hypothetical protein [Candidatus Omnitrophota bacterium]
MSLKADNSFRALYLVIFLSALIVYISLSFAKEVRRDPFVPLVDNQGNIRSGQNLFVPAEEIAAKIVLKGILWDAKNPIAVINGKVLSEGSQLIVEDAGFAKTVIVQKINPDSVILNYNDREFEIKLRKKEKE